MKKTYLTPETALQRITLENLLAGSVVWDDENNSGSDETHDEDATGPALGKINYSVWEDEEEN